MATKRKTAAEIREEEIVKAEAEMMDEDYDTSSGAGAPPSPQGEGLYDEKDAEIARLKAELAQARKASVSEVFVPNGRGDMQRLKALAEETVAEGTDEWKVTVKVRVPRKSGEDDFWINVNGISAQIPANGEIQELKLPWALALMDALEAEDRALDFADGIKNYDPVNNPKPMMD